MWSVLNTKSVTQMKIAGGGGEVPILYVSFWPGTLVVNLYLPIIILI